MEKYKPIYNFEVIGALKEGKNVHMLDRKTDSVYIVFSMNTGFLIEALDSKEENRFDFWVVENIEEEVAE